MHWIFLLVSLNTGIFAQKANPPSGASLVSISYTVLPQSRVTISGSSNVSHFTCVSPESHGIQRAEYHPGEMAHTMTFRNTHIQLTIDRFDCGSRAMNRDLQNTLNAVKYPQIDITLWSARLLTAHQDSDTEKYEVRTEVTIAGCTQSVLLIANVQSAGTSTLRMRAEKALLMTDFEIEPPTALLGLIKVRPEITISLDLLINFKLN